MSPFLASRSNELDDICGAAGRIVRMHRMVDIAHDSGRALTLGQWTGIRTSRQTRRQAASTTISTSSVNLLPRPRSLPSLTHSHAVSAIKVFGYLEKPVSREELSGLS